MNVETICHEALSLPPQEAAHRAEEMDKGLVQRIPADVVYQEALALLK